MGNSPAYTAPAARRRMVNHFEELCVAVCFWPEKVISRAQLPMLLASVNGELFARLLFDWFGLALDDQAKLWFSFDGKELRAGRPVPQHPAGPQAGRGLRLGPVPPDGADRGANLLQRHEGKRTASGSQAVG